ncbi:MAG TPA: RluA family pseudouridine synthase [Candidatus Saccharimonadales bacterium]|nr:RluA family pseudouridine synthase [Candidatus Saccharimonadales bacterium]
MNKEYVVEQNNEGVRLDVYVAKQYPRFTRSALEALFEQKLVFLNQKAAKPSQKVKAGDKIDIDESLLRLDPPKIDLPIIYEDKNVAVIDKPAGILTHSKGALNLEGTVASFIGPKLKELEGNRAGIVHRLDRATSGVIITAKNPEALSKLQKQFSKRKAKKTYLAIVEGALEPPEAIIDAPVMRNLARPQTFKVSAAGKPALTTYETIKTFRRGAKTYSLLKLTPQTGRTHQLRVHLAYIGHPIVGDPIYGQESEGGLMLHAASLEITLPGSERRVFEAKIPARIREFADA